jgi:hypothetical protein
MSLFTCLRIGVVAGALCAVPVLHAATTTIDFENLAVGTIVTTQYAGVTFSAPPGSCGGNPPIRPVIVTPNGGTSSPTKALSLQTGCPDFSPDFLRLVFDDPQSEVTFTLGDSPGTYQVRAYNVPAGGAPVSTQNVVIAGTGWAGVFRFVRVVRTQNDIRRIEIEDTVDDFEVIDDLTFMCADTTPPEATITVPTFEQCVCGNFAVRGTACDVDGTYDNDKLEYLSVTAAPGTAWTLIGTAGTPLCEEGNLYFWNTTLVPEGCYYLRLTVENECGLTSEAVTTACVDRHFDNVDLRSPGAGGIFGGTLCFDGTVYDRCFDNYTVKYRPTSGGPFNPVDPANPVYTPAGGVLNDPFAFWNTEAGGAAVVDGNYQVQVVATDDCGNSTTITRTITIDNTAPIAFIATPVACTYVNGVVEIHGTVSDAHLQSWTLQWAGAGQHNWAPPIAVGNAPVINGLLGTWDTSALPECAYVLRLVASDSAVLDCQSPFTNQTEYFVVVNVGTPQIARGDINCDGVVNFGDINPFVNCMVNGGCPPCP